MLDECYKRYLLLRAEGEKVSLPLMNKARSFRKIESLTDNISCIIIYLTIRLNVKRGA